MQNKVQNTGSMPTLVFVDLLLLRMIPPGGVFLAADRC